MIEMLAQLSHPMPVNLDKPSTQQQYQHPALVVSGPDAVFRAVCLCVCVEMLAQLNRQMPVNRDRRGTQQQYQHPRGAPDADVIFGSK